MSARTEFPNSQAKPLRVGIREVEVVIVRTGVANMASVVAAFERLGARTVITSDAALVARASHVMLPGVGAFGAGMAALNVAGLGEALVGRIRDDKPTIAICLGLQLLCESSEETAGVKGLGVLPVQVTRFASALENAAQLKVPQLGWNRVEAPEGARFLKSGHAYFANSFRISQARAEEARPLQRDQLNVWQSAWHIATANYGGNFVAALERGNILACQFHPELSGPWGQQLLQRWLATNDTNEVT